MSNRSALIVSGFILLGFFVAGLLDMMYGWEILENLVSKIILFGLFIGFIVYLIKVNINKQNKNLP